MYVKVLNGSPESYPYSIGDLRNDNPDTSFPNIMSDEGLASWDVYPVSIVQDPAHDPRTHRVVNDILPTLIGGAWIIGKSIVEKSQHEKDEYRDQEIKKYERAVQSHMDTTVRERGYDSILSATSYATSSNSRYGPEAIACRDWRDSVWDKCYEVLAEVDAETRQPPTVDELIAELPTLTWP